MYRRAAVILQVLQRTDGALEPSLKSKMRMRAPASKSYAKYIHCIYWHVGKGLGPTAPTQAQLHKHRPARTRSLARTYELAYSHARARSLKSPCDTAKAVMSAIFLYNPVVIKAFFNSSNNNGQWSPVIKRVVFYISLRLMMLESSIQRDTFSGYRPPGACSFPLDILISYNLILGCSNIYEIKQSSKLHIQYSVIVCQ